jgi:hypothetical protein
MAYLSTLVVVLAFLLSQPLTAFASQAVTPSESTVGSETMTRADHVKQDKRRKGHTASPEKTLTKEGRLAFIRTAQVWTPTNVAAMDLRAGPQGKDAFAPNEMVTCDYVKTKLPGSSRKFNCVISEGNVVKIRYGTTNGEVEGAVLASRLLWALGFGADRVYPVRVRCQGCSSDPWTKQERAPGAQMFDPAAIERKPDGHEMKTGEKDAGWAWPELALVDEAQGGAQRAQRDALTLLAVFMQHTAASQNSSASCAFLEG